MIAAARVQRPGDSLVSCATALSAGAARLEAIEAARRAAGMAQDRLASAALITGQWYRVLLRAPGRATPAVLERLARAIAGEGSSQVQRQANEARLIRATYDAMLAYLCGARGQPFLATRDGAVNGRLTDRRERELLRQAARYLANTHLGLPQAALGRALGISKVAVHLALKTVEDLRDDPAWDRLLTDAEGSIGVRS